MDQCSHPPCPRSRWCTRRERTAPPGRRTPARARDRCFHGGETSCQQNDSILQCFTNDNLLKTSTNWSKAGCKLKNKFRITFKRSNSMACAAGSLWFSPKRTTVGPAAARLHLSWQSAERDSRNTDLERSSPEPV